MAQPSPTPARDRALRGRRPRRQPSGRTDSIRDLEAFKYALDHAAIVAITDGEGRITYVNDKFCEISQYSREALTGQDHRIVNSGHHSSAFMREMWRAISSGQVWRGEIRNRARDGSIYWVDTTIVPLLDDQGRPHQYLAIHADITQRKRAEAQLREQESLARLGELSAMVAHEVRNPLAGLKGALQVLRARLPETGAERVVLDAMVDRLDVLNHRVNDILLFASPRHPARQPVVLGPPLAEAAASARAAVPGPPIAIDPRSGTVRAIADADLLREAFLNLFLNACQAAGADGDVEATVEHDGTTCVVRILDRGPGIPPAIRDRAFEPFVSTKTGGTGLGLPIVKRLVEQLGGAIAIGDREGGGTSVTVTLPDADRTSSRGRSAWSDATVE